MSETTIKPLNHELSSSSAGNVKTKKPTSLPNCGSTTPKGDCAMASRKVIQFWDMLMLAAPPTNSDPANASRLKCPVLPVMRPQ